ncbi:hypothetical protein BH23CHL8_BH23CHL8_27760 [soil metagenome]
MSGSRAGRDRAAFGQVEPEPINLSPEVLAALQEVTAARQAAGASLDELSGAVQSALDVPAKIRRNPAKAAALAGGAGFLVLGGPKRMLRFVSRQLRPQERDPHAGLLPDEVERVLRDSGVADDPEVRRALEKDFAEYLRRKGRAEPPPNAATTFWRTFDRVAGPLGTAGARILVGRLMQAEKRRDGHRSGDGPTAAPPGPDDRREG